MRTRFGSASKNYLSDTVFCVVGPALNWLITRLRPNDQNDDVAHPGR